MKSRIRSLDAIINSAAILLGMGQKLEQLDMEQVEQSFQTNLFGPIVVLKHFLPLLRQGVCQSIINISSEAGSFAGAYDGDYSYALSKSALNMFSAQLRRELAPQGIVVHALQESSLRRYYASVPSSDYLFLLSQADLLVGNSSSGIIEAPFFQLPFVNIGSRQKNRTNAANVIHAEYEETNIKEAVSASLEASRGTIVENPYDLFDCPEQEIVRVLKYLSEHPQLLNKR